MAWLTLVLAGLFETGFTFCLGKARQADGNASFLWYGGFGLCLVLSMLLLMQCTRTLPLGTAYAVWTGIGAFGTALIGIFVFGEAATAWRLVFLFTLIVSVIGLKFVAE